MSALEELSGCADEYRRTLADAERLRALRTRLMAQAMDEGASQADLARAMRISPSRVYQMMAVQPPRN